MTVTSHRRILILPPHTFISIQTVVRRETTSVCVCVTASVDERRVHKCTVIILCGVVVAPSPLPSHSPHIKIKYTLLYSTTTTPVQPRRLFVILAQRTAPRSSSPPPPPPPIASHLPLLLLLAGLTD